MILLLLLLLLSPLTQLFANNPDYTYFQKIHSIPYGTIKDEGYQNPHQLHKNNKGDCHDKAIAYADYLHYQGHKPLIVIREGLPGCHAYVICDNRVFDPTLTPPIYNMTTTDYDLLWRIASPLGYTTVKQEYKPVYNYEYVLCELMAGDT